MSTNPNRGFDGFVFGDTDDVRQVKLNNMLSGKLNCVDTFTLTTGEGADATHTVVVDRRLGANSVVMFMAINDDAAAFDYLGSTVSAAIVIDVETRTMTITHASAAGTEEFRYAIIG